MTATKHNQYRSQAHYECSNWVDDTKIRYNPSKGTGCLIIAIVICVTFIGIMILSVSI